MSLPVQYSIVIPVYNEEKVIEQTYGRLKNVMESTKATYELIFVDDGSEDLTSEIIKNLRNQDETIKLLSFSRNFGHQIAITAGMDYASGDAVIAIDADLQDPPELIPEMIAKWKEGYKVVYAKRTKRKGETFFKKQTAHLFYRLLHASTDIEIPVNTGDFRLLDKKVCSLLKKLPEKNRYVRGLVSWTGFRQVAIEYERDERVGGETKYTLKKMFKLSWDGLTSFSFKPLEIANYFGITLVLAGFVYLAILLWREFSSVSSLSGWQVVLDIQFLMSGIILTTLGIVGQYIGRIYDETRDRPLYIVGETFGLGKKESPREKV
ncbi:MAG: glycosyltransferase family 2 protein [Peptococcaceae bacterium]|nr:glycosyltransferase family 2 protein [Peptococcaceae bacterium]